MKKIKCERCGTEGLKHFEECPECHSEAYHEIYNDKQKPLKNPKGSVKEEKKMHKLKCKQCKSDQFNRSMEDVVELRGNKAGDVADKLVTNKTYTLSCRECGWNVVEDELIKGEEIEIK